MIDGETLQQAPEEYRKKIGYIPETPSLYEELTLKEHIEVTALAYDIPLEEAFKRAEPLLKTFRLDNKLEWFPANFSKGMKQKVMVLCAFLIEPSLYIIDEPVEIGKDIYQHPRTTMDENAEFLINRPLKVKLIEEL